MVKDILKYLVSFLGIQIQRSESRKFNRLAKFGIPHEEWRRQNGKYYLVLLNVEVGDLNSPLITGYGMAKDLKLKGGGRFFFDENNDLQLELKGIYFFVRFTDELYVIKEVFISGDYNFTTNKDVIIIDIGMNIGATSLYFEKNKHVKKIYSYELFEETYQSALRNLKINNSHKVIPFNFGLGRDTCTLHIPYSVSSKARMGFNGLPLDEKFTDVKKVKVHVKDVAEEFNRVNQLEPKLSKVCKMDCEGAEYEILDRLFETEAIMLVKLYIIEWHERNTNEIESSFTSRGFDVIKTTFNTGHTGLIYAFKPAS